MVKQENMIQIITDMYEEVKNRCALPSNIYGRGAWPNHIKLVYEIAISIYEEYEADYNIVALASILHDVAAVTSKDFTEEHHVFGAKIAEELLSKYDLDKDFVERIKACILNHRGSKPGEKTTPEEVCVADADAMAHFYSIPSLFSMVYLEKGLSIDEGEAFVYDKLLRSYDKLSEKGKKLITPHYEAVKILFKGNSK